MGADTRGHANEKATCARKKVSNLTDGSASLLARPGFESYSHASTGNSHSISPGRAERRLCAPDARNWAAGIPDVKAEISKGRSGSRYKKA
ncbi:hypothetical protein KM043_011005 [Ampulex compressa]|nr:hypothetical protein KM043_011005 [Ampulex compressa]